MQQTGRPRPELKLDIDRSFVALEATEWWGKLGGKESLDDHGDV